MEEAFDGADSIPRRVPKGIFINTAQANCSIYESGRMVHHCIQDSDAYTLDYFSLDAFDVTHFAATGKIRSNDPTRIGEPDAMEDYDFWVFNWHPYTMASHLQPESIFRLQGLKFTVVLELAPDDPLQMVPPGVFDGYIALDPAAPLRDNIFPFPRPLEGDPRDGRLAPRSVPVIGSFGYGTPGKGFELLVEAVNRQFDRAVVRVNIATGTYVSTAVIHKTDYGKHIESVCKRIAKPGIDVRFTYDFMSPEELVDWCADNDLNCFMYTRCQPGLSATTDQAVMSGRPLLTLANDTFRHVHRYIPPYPVLSFKDAIDATSESVSKIQQDWSRESFNRTFHRMLASFDLIAANADDPQEFAVPDEPPLSVLLASNCSVGVGDVLEYPTRLADSLSRSGKFRISRVACRNAVELEESIDALRPSAVILLGYSGAERGAAALAMTSVVGPKILLDESSSTTSVASETIDDAIKVLGRRPIIPFFTLGAGLRDAPNIWLIGFSSTQSNLEEVVTKIAKERPGTHVLVEVPAGDTVTTEKRVSRLKEMLFDSTGIQFSIPVLPDKGVDVLHSFAADSLIVFHHDPSRAAYLEDVSCLAMTTERSVVFTRAAPFPRYEGRETYFEDASVTDLIDLGMAAQIKLLHDFGEWQFSTELTRFLLPGRMPTRSTTLGGFETNSKKSTSYAAPKAPAAPIENSRTVFLMIGASGVQLAQATYFIRRFCLAWAGCCGTVRIVLWDDESKRLLLASFDELLGFGLEKEARSGLSTQAWDRGPQVIGDQAFCGPDDWLLVPETLGAMTGRPELVEMNAILEARRLGLRSAFIFHGAERLRSTKFAGDMSAAHEQFMQTLLLADVVIPVSRLASDDLDDFFVQHQLADSVPLIRKIAYPAETGIGDDDRWFSYALGVKSVLLEAADLGGRLVAVYHWVDPKAPLTAAPTLFAQRLVGALEWRGLDVIPVTWNSETRELVTTDRTGAEVNNGAANLVPVPIDPRSADAPKWLFILDRVQVGVFTEVAEFAAKHALRIAAILQEGAPGPRQSTVDSEFDAVSKAEFEALASADKVFAVSTTRFDDFYRFLLSGRGKVHSAEHRFKTLVPPHEADTSASSDRSWDQYAADIAAECMTDRLTDLLYSPSKRFGRDVYETLVNLRRRPKLSLCISTYNRSGWLGVNLRNIFNQITEERADLEILVVDNASTDNTPEVVVPYLPRRDFRYVRNARNVGMLGNLAVTAQTARGDYIWILGDDDLTRPGVILKILAILEQRLGIAMIYLNYGYTSESNPASVTDLSAFLTNYNVLEPSGPDLSAPVRLLAAKCENFFTAIYSQIFKRDHAMKAYGQDTSGRIFSTMLSCIPTAYYALHYMHDLPAHWIGDPALVVNSNVSWADYGALLDLEQLPRAWDLAERVGCAHDEVDRRRANRLWLVEMMWRQIFESDPAGNSAYFSAPRVLMRIKHLREIEQYISDLKAVYERAHQAGHPAASLAPELLFSAFLPAAPSAFPVMAQD